MDDYEPDEEEDQEARRGLSEEHVNDLHFGGFEKVDGEPDRPRWAALCACARVCVRVGVRVRVRVCVRVCACMSDVGV